MARPKKTENVTADVVVAEENKEQQEVKQDKLITVTLKNIHSPKHIVYLKGEFVVFEDRKAKVTKATASKLKEMGLI